MHAGRDLKELHLSSLQPETPEPVQMRSSDIHHVRACSADFQDDGQELSQEEWADYFQTQLQGIREGPADGAESQTEEDTDPDDPFSDMPDSFGDDFSRPGVRPYSHHSLSTLGRLFPHQPGTSQRACTEKLKPASTWMHLWKFASMACKLHSRMHPCGLGCT